MIQNDKIFYNFSDEDFTWKFNGTDFTFKAGSLTPMTEGEFGHFQKHLVDRELGKMHKDTNDEVSRAPLMEKCNGGEKVEEAPKVVEAPKRFCEHCSSRGVRHMKDCSRPIDKIEKPFADAVA